jgi:predicted lactoylglutathione lyase
MRAISIVTLGVRDLDTSTRFYEEIGFTKSEKSSSSITWFRTGSTILTLYPWTSRSQDAGLPESGSGFRGITLALNMQNRELVDEFIETVRRSGGKIVKEPMQVFWGGYSSYFSDPDGHLWEVAWNPYTDVDEVGNLTVEK